MTTYKYEKESITALITNKKRYWVLEVVSGDINIVIDRNIFNTKRASKEYAMKVISNYY